MKHLQFVVGKHGRSLFDTCSVGLDVSLPIGCIEGGFERIDHPSFHGSLQLGQMLEENTESRPHRCGHIGRQAIAQLAHLPRPHRDLGGTALGPQRPQGRNGVLDLLFQRAQDIARGRRADGVARRHNRRRRDRGRDRLCHGPEQRSQAGVFGVALDLLGVERRRGRPDGLATASRPDETCALARGACCCRCRPPFLSLRGSFLGHKLLHAQTGAAFNSVEELLRECCDQPLPLTLGTLLRTSFFARAGLSPNTCKDLCDELVAVFLDGALGGAYQLQGDVCDETVRGGRWRGC